MNEPIDVKSKLEIFLGLEKEVRAAKDVRTISFIISNLSKRLLPYSQAFVWQKAAMGFNVIAFSATSSINNKAPYIVWLQTNVIPWLRNKYKDKAVIVNKADLSDELMRVWDTYLPDYIIYCPFKNFFGADADAGAVFISETPWNENHLTITTELQQLYEHAWQLVSRPEQKKIIMRLFTKKKRYGMIVGSIIMIIIILLLPVRQTVLANAEVAPKNPILISSSIEGIIQTIAVEPNQLVKQNQLLFTLDKVTLENNYQQAQAALLVAEERYRRAYQGAYNDPKAKADILVLDQDVKKAKNDLEYAKTLLERSQITAPAAGIIIFSSPKYWLGRPIKIGEQVMLLAIEKDKKLDIEVPQADMISIQHGDAVNFYPDIDPLNSIKATVDYASYIATPTANNKLDYYVAANFEAGENIPRYGAHGTAKLYGRRVTLFFYIFKRPLIYLQSKLGI